MSYVDLSKGRYSENGRAYFITTVLAEREQRYFGNFFCARLVVAEMRGLHESSTVNSLAWVLNMDVLMSRSTRMYESDRYAGSRALVVPVG